MITITTNEGSLLIRENGSIIQTINKGQQACKVINNKVILGSLNSSVLYDLPATTTVDGVASANADALADKLSSFSKGGGQRLRGCRNNRRFS